jgi:hypothetical protein
MQVHGWGFDPRPALGSEGRVRVGGVDASGGDGHRHHGLALGNGEGDWLKLSRPELLLCAVYSAVMGFCPIVYAPTSKQVDTVLGWSLWTLAAVCLGFAFRPRPVLSDMSLPARALRALSRAVVFLAVLGVSLWMHAYGYLLSFIMSQALALTLAAVEVVTFVACLIVAWRRPPLRPWAMGIGATLLFIGSFQYVVMAAGLYGPADPEICESALQPGHVERLTPASWASEPSQPFTLQYIPERSWLLANFKMGGNGSFGFWNNAESNRVVGLDVRDPKTLAVAPLGDVRTVLHMAYRPESDELVVSRQGGTTHALDVVSLADFPRIKKVRSVEVEHAPHLMMMHPDGQRYGVASEHGVVGVFDAETLEEQARHFLGLDEEHVPVPLYGWHAPGTATFYVSVLVYPLVRVDIDTGEVEWSPGTYGGGHVVGHPPTSELVMTDMLMNRVVVLDEVTMEERRSITVDYTPRAVQMDTDRDLLMVGGWFTGRVTLYRLSTLEPLDLSVQVGPSLRDLAVDTERGLLFTASTCGVYQVQLDALLSTAPGGASAGR